MGRPLARPSPSPLGTPPPRRLANFPRPECPGRTSSLPFLNNFAFGCHDLHSPARRSEPRNNKGVESTQQFGSPQSALCCAPRGFASGRHLRHSRTAPKPAPLPHISLLPPSRLRRGRGSAKPLSTLPPTPSSRIRLDGCGVCACAQRGRGGGGESGRLEKAGAAGCGGGAPGLSLLFPRSGSPLWAWPGSHTCALKTHFKVSSRGRGGPLGAGLRPSRGPPTRPGTSPALPIPGTERP